MWVNRFNISTRQEWLWERQVAIHTHRCLSKPSHLFFDCVRQCRLVGHCHHRIQCRLVVSHTRKLFRKRKQHTKTGLLRKYIQLVSLVGKSSGISQCVCVCVFNIFRALGLVATHNNLFFPPFFAGHFHTHTHQPTTSNSNANTTDGPPPHFSQVVGGQMARRWLFASVGHCD